MWVWFNHSPPPQAIPGKIFGAVQSVAIMLPTRTRLLASAILLWSLLSLNHALPVTYNFTLDDFLSINNLRSGAPAYSARNSRFVNHGDAGSYAVAEEKPGQSPAPAQMYAPVTRTSRDLDLSESGYIFRSDQNSPPMLIKLGAADDDKFNSMLKKAGISMPHDGITYSSDSTTSYKPPKVAQASPFVFESGSEQRGSEEDSKEAVRSYTPSESSSSEYNGDFKLNPVALVLQSNEDSEQDSPSRSYGNGPTKPAITEDEVSYTYTQEPIRFEYVSHSADDDGYEELLKRLNGEGEGGDLEEVYKPPKSSGKPLYESSRSFEGFDHGSPSIDLKLDSKSGLSKSFIAPIFELPASYDSSFDRHTAPVKYTLKNKKPKYVAPVQADPHEGHEDYHEYDKDGGGSYGSDHHSDHGHSQDKGFKDYSEYDTKEKSKYSKEEDKGFYNGKDGHKKHHYNEGDKYGEHHNRKKGLKGSKFGSSGYHKKGHKTNGYHNVFHKDEFKKEHKFYDDAKKEGFFDKYGNYHKKTGTKGGGKHDTGFHESGYDAAHAGKDGLYDKGFVAKEHRGHDGKSGHSSDFADFQEHDKKFGHEEGNKYGGYADTLSHR